MNTPESMVANFNASTAVGARVTVQFSGGAPRHTRTAEPAQVMSGFAVVRCDGICGHVSLYRVSQGWV